MPRQATYTLNAAHTTDKTLQELLAHTLKIAGCGTCGRLSKLHVEFLGDPPPDIEKLGVIDQVLVGLAARG
jgi:hypothetical protein